MSIPGRTWLVIREHLTLGNAENATRRFSMLDRIEIRSEIESAVRRMREAERAEFAVRRVELAREAVRQLIVAVATAKLKLQSDSPLDWPSADEALITIRTLPGIDGYSAALLAAFDDATAVLAEEAFGELSALFVFLERQVDVRTPRDFQLIRWARICGFGVATACVLGFATSPRNLALDCKVSVSAEGSGAATPRPVGPKFGRAVDGYRYEVPFALGTTKKLHPWIEVDLGDVYTISEIAVYGRSDGYWGTDDVPAGMLVSTNGKDYESVGTTSVPFTPDLPWRLSLKPMRARFVRLTGVAGRPQQLFIGEFEVYGR
jgi:hypothetical protein